eukprot:4150177-Heterocapsa_arctica.AAC.1
MASWRPGGDKVFGWESILNLTNMSSEPQTASQVQGNCTGACVRAVGPQGHRGAEGRSVEL